MKNGVTAITDTCKGFEISGFQASIESTIFKKIQGPKFAFTKHQMQVKLALATISITISYSANNTWFN